METRRRTVVVSTRELLAAIAEDTARRGARTAPLMCECGREMPTDSDVCPHCAGTLPTDRLWRIR